MRPDKKGKRKSRPRQGAAIGDHSKDKADKAAKEAMLPGPQKFVPQSESPAAPAPAVAHHGPRVLEPAAPPAAAAQLAKRRNHEIHSSWQRYEEPADLPAAPNEDFLRGDTFEEIVALSGTGLELFRLRNERSWLEEMPAASDLLTLDVDFLAAVLRKIPLHERLGVAEHHFTAEELEVFAAEARGSAAPAAPATAVDRLRAQQSDRDAICRSALNLLRQRETSGGGRTGPSAPGGVTGLPAERGAETSTAGDAGNSTACLSTGEPPSAAPPQLAGGAAPEPPAAFPGGTEQPAAAAAAAAAAGGPTPAASSLLQDDWLDSLLSDED